MKKIASLLKDGIYYQISYKMRPNLECISDFSKNSECKIYMTTSENISASTFTKNVFGLYDLFNLLSAGSSSSTIIY